jgi:hypothetical protein
MRLDPDPKLTESNQKSEFWTGSGSNPTKNMFGFAVGLNKLQWAFWIGFDQVWTCGGNARELIDLMSAVTRNQPDILLRVIHEVSFGYTECYERYKTYSGVIV